MGLADLEWISGTCRPGMESRLVGLANLEWKVDYWDFQTLSGKRISGTFRPGVELQIKKSCNAYVQTPLPCGS